MLAPEFHFFAELLRQADVLTTEQAEKVHDLIDYGEWERPGPDARSEPRATP